MKSAADLKDLGLKVTGPRMKILRLFSAEHNRHLSADDVYRLLIHDEEEIGLATVYRVLTQFEQAGILVRHHFEGGKAVFELREEGHHDHLVCVNCGRVEEFCDPEIERRQEAIARERGFNIREHSLYLYVECIKAECPRREPAR